MLKANSMILVCNYKEDNIHNSESNKNMEEQTGKVTLQSQGLVVIKKREREGRI